MRLRKSADNELEFRKKLEKDIHGFSFRKFIEFIIKELHDEKSESSNSQISSEEDKNDISDDDDAISQDDESIDAGELETTLNTIAGKNTVTGQSKRRNGFIVNQ